MDKEEFIKIMKERGFDDEFIKKDLELAKEVEETGLVYPYEVTLKFNQRPIDPPYPAGPESD